MKLKDAVIIVLQQTGTPLHTKDITARILSAGLWQTEGKTPDATVSARLYENIKEKGERSPFVQVAPNTFALRYAAISPSLPPPFPTKTSPPPKSTPRGLSFMDCAQKVLETFADKKAMHYKDITQCALDQGWLITSSKTPEATMYAQIFNDIKRQKQRGERPRFIQYERGYVGLSQWLGEHDFALKIAQHNQNIRRHLHRYLREMKPSAFEALVKELLAAMGFEMVELTPVSGDGGIDVRGVLVMSDVVRIKMAVQVKRWKSNVQAPIVQQVRGSLGAHEQGLIITTSDFSRGAQNEANQSDKTPIALMNGEALVSLLMEHGIGVQRSSLDWFELDEAFFAE